jgi:hypothetical protein
MTLKDLLQKNKTAIAERWLDRTLETYASRTAIFFKQKKDPFANPVGQALRSGTKAIVDELFEAEPPLGAESANRLCAHLEDIIKIRAVQELNPSQALSFVLSLKQAIREVLEEELEDSRVVVEWMSFETRIDQLVLFAFDIYTKSREELFELRMNEIKRTGFRLLKKSNLIVLDEDPEPEEDWAMNNLCRPRGGGS